MITTKVKTAMAAVVALIMFLGVTASAAQTDTVEHCETITADSGNPVKLCIQIPAPTAVPVATPTPEPTATPVPDATAVWSGVDVGEDQRPTITIDDSIYPVDPGVQFLLNGVIDERSSSRPDGYDPTGPQDDSTFHMFPNITLDAGDLIEARWMTASGDSYSTSVVVGGGDPVPTSTPAPTVEPTTGPTPAPTVDVPVSCVSNNPNQPTDDPNPAYNGTVGRYPVSANPVPDGYPTPATTGICAAGLTPADLTVTAGMTITQDGTVIDGMDITGGVLVMADNVTIRNSRITSTSRYTLQLAFGYQNLLVENVRIRGEGEAVSTATYFQGFATLRRVNISGGNDMMKASGGMLVEDSYFAGSYLSPGTHNDVVQVRTGSDYTFRRNSMLGNWQQQTSVFLFQAKAGAGGGPISDVLIEDNYLSGGGYTVYTNADDFSFTNTLVQNNRIELDSYQFGPFSSTANEAVYLNNVTVAS